MVVKPPVESGCLSKRILTQEAPFAPQTRTSRVFVNSMSDLFHERMPFDFLREIFEVMAECERHVFQILTKRHERLLELSPKLEWPENVWMGVSVENQAYAHRVDYLRRVRAAVRFLSCEPLLGPLELDLEGIHWVIVGGESVPKHRPIEAGWVREIREQSHEASTAFFFKQWRAYGPRPAAGSWTDIPTTRCRLHGTGI
jgi:protein gp37